MDHYYFLMRLVICFMLSFLIVFLGAGAIAIDENKVKDLNTAATIWGVVAIGILVGLKLIFEACIGTFVIIFTNVSIRKIKKKVFPERCDDDL